MKKLLFLLCCIVLCACSDEKDGFEPYYLKYKVEGITLKPSKKNDGTVVTEILASGVKFTLTGTEEKYSNFYFISEVCVTTESGPEYCVHIDDRYKFEDFERDWGRFHYLTDTPPYVIEIEIFPNQGEEERELSFQLGFGYWIALCRLKQPPLNAE